MPDFWEEELTEAQTTELLEKAAFQVRRRKMSVPAILALEMHKPLTFVASNAALAFSPFLVPLLGFDRVNVYTRLFSKRENVERLLVMLEQNGPPAEASPR